MAVPARTIGLATMLLASCGGGRAADRHALEYGSGEDVAAILRAGGVQAALSCANPTQHGQVIRAVACTTRLSPEQLATLTAALPLAPGEARNRPPSHAGSCEATPGLSSSTPGVEVLVGTNTKVPNGARRVALHVQRATGAVCIEIEYPWSE